jgi:LacI family transcriptional regulator
MSLAKLAKTLDLSVTTVSRALGGFSDVAEPTRRRVLAEAERIGYRPNSSARRLRSGLSDAIGIVLPTGPGQLDDPFFLKMIGALGPRLAQAGLDLIVCCARAGAEELALYRQLVANRRVDGLIVARTRRQDERIGFLIDHGLPFVVHGRTEESRPHAYVDVDGAAAFREATERLIGFGHERIAFINAPARYNFAAHREAGWRDAMRDAGLANDTALEGEASEENGFRLMQPLLQRPARPTAVLCATDRLAVGALHALAHAGLRAGSDVSVIGYDNLPVATYVAPPLTTFDPGVDAAVARMVEMMLAQLGGAAPDDMAEVRRAALVARASDGPAPESDVQNGQSKSRRKREVSDEKDIRS